MTKNILRWMAYNLFMKGLLSTRLIISHKNCRNGKAFIVVGAEGSGNRMIQRFFIGCGCYGNKSHKQLFDYTNPEPPMELVVWRTSIPHSLIKKPNAKKMYLLMKKLGYNTTIVEIRRDFKETISSQVKRKFVKNEKEAQEKIIRAWRYIDSLKKEFPNNFLRIDYNKFVNSQIYRKEISKKLGLEHNEVEEYKIKRRGLFEEGKPLKNSIQKTK